MKAKLGTILIILGFAFLFGAAGLFVYNEHVQNKAAESVDNLMPQIVEIINIRQTEQEEPIWVPPDERKMETAEIGGAEYLGFVGIQSLGLELPVMADWDYEKLKTAPCRYSGSVFTEDLVIMAHNYKKHFGRLSQLTVGDRVTFTDIGGETLYYEVVAVEILPSKAVEEMTSGEFDLTLFTCNYSGESRVAVRCDLIPEN